MLKYSNVLSQQLLEDIKVERENKQKNGHEWKVGEFFWQDKLLYGVTNSCVASAVSNSLKHRIETELKSKLPPFTNLLVQHYIWLRGSGISKHHDTGHGFGATVYLNEEWDINYGGIFLWKEKTASDYIGIVPTYNSMVVNTTKEEHLVTPISLNSPQLRYTIQIWPQN
jgi:Rps23 Pro-64 3,4-dihydroxylase Tpa1-like proline 4-hydroxylase